MRDAHKFVPKSSVSIVKTKKSENKGRKLSVLVDLIYKSIRKSINLAVNLIRQFIS